MQIDIKDYVSVSDFLGKDFDSVLDLILEARHYLKSFYDDAVLSLEMNFDPEEGYHDLGCHILTNNKDAEEDLYKFEDLWLLDNMARFKKRVTFSIKHVEVDNEFHG